MTNRRGLIVLSLVLGAAALVFLLRERGGPPPGAPSQASAQQAAADAPAPTSAAKVLAAPRGPAPTLAAAGLTVERLERARDDYLAVAVYPDWSRPLDEGSEYKLRWNEPVVSELPFGEATGIRYHFAADRAHLVRGQSLTSWIEAWRGDDRADRVAVTVHEAWVTDGRQRYLALLYQPDPRGVMTNTFAPGDYDELDGPGRQLRILADVEIAGERRIVIRDFTYAPQKVLTIRAIRDAVENGNLVVRLDLDVHQPGLVTFEANALTQDGFPLGYTHVSHPLQPGPQTVDLTFFGKLFHDHKSPGPYLVKDFRGTLIPPNDDDYYLWWSDPRTHLTAAHPLSALSPAAWDSPEKQQKLQHFQDLIEETSRGDIGHPLAD